MRILVGFLFWVLMAAPIWASPVRVLSGEHGDFTRFVFYLDTPAVWSLEQRGTEVVLTLDGHRDGFDTSEVFDRIDRDRVQSIRTTTKKNGLVLDLACPCRATAVADGSLLILDVHDQKVLEPLSVPPPSDPVADARLDFKQPTQIRATEAWLEQALQQGQRAGWITGSPSPSGFSTIPVPNSLVQLATHSPIGEDPGRADHGADATASCRQWSDDQATWADGDFAAMRLKTRADLAQSEQISDRAAAVLESAHAMIGFGLGREALDLLGYPALRADPEATQLRALGEIVSGIGAKSEFLATTINCGARARLWAVLSGQAVDRAATDDLINQFRDLPAPLRNVLRARFSKRIGTLGGSEARATLDQVEQYALHATDSVADTDVSLSTLWETARGGGASAPHALLALSKMLPDDDPAISTLTGLLAAAAVQYRGHDIQLALRQAHVAQLIRLGDFDSALDQISKTNAEDLVDLLFKAVSAGANDATFLRFSLLHKDGVSAATEHVLAARLLDMNFPDLVLKRLGADVPPPEHAERRILRARASFMLGDHISAKLELMGLTSPAADEIRAQMTQTLVQPTAQPPHTIEAVETHPVSAPENPLAIGRSLLDQSATHRAQLFKQLQPFGEAAQ